MGDVIRNISIAATAAIPNVGGSVSYLLDKSIPEYVQKKYYEFINELETDIKSIEDKIDYSRFESPEFVSIFQKIIDEVICSELSIRRDLYKNILLNSLTCGVQRFNKNDYFLNITSNISDDEIQSLFVLYIRGNQPDMVSKLTKKYPKFKNYIVSFSAELARSRLTNGDRLTPLGYEYCDFVFNPLAPQIILRG